MKKKKYLSVCHMLELECDFFGCFIPLYEIKITILSLFNSYLQERWKVSCVTSQEYV